MKNIMEMFNEGLQKLPTEKERLITVLKEYPDKTKRDILLDIVKKERFKLDIFDPVFQPDPHAYFKSVDIFLTYKKCGIKDGDRIALKEYVESLLEVLNHSSNILEFSIGYVDCEEEFVIGKGITFDIECSF